MIASLLSALSLSLYKKEKEDFDSDSENWDDRWRLGKIRVKVQRPAGETG